MDMHARSNKYGVFLMEAIYSGVDHIQSGFIKDGPPD